MTLPAHATQRKARCLSDHRLRGNVLERVELSCPGAVTNARQAPSADLVQPVAFSQPSDQLARSLSATNEHTVRILRCVMRPSGHQQAAGEVRALEVGAQVGRTPSVAETNGRLQHSHTRQVRREDSFKEPADECTTGSGAPDVAASNRQDPRASLISARRLQDIGQPCVRVRSC